MYSLVHVLNDIAGAKEPKENLDHKTSQLVKLVDSLPGLNSSYAVNHETDRP